MLLFAEIATALLVIATALPFVPVSHGLIRIGDFPRQQIAVLAIVLLAVSLTVQDGRTPWYFVIALLGAVAAVQAWFVLPFTPLWRKQTADFKTGRDGSGQKLRLMACNVKMSNRKFDALAALVTTHDPDIVVLMEVDQDWMDALAPVFADHSSQVLHPLDNSYGLALLSRFELIDPKVEDLLTEGVPSVIATVALPDGQHFRLYAIHPEPPVPHRSAEGRDGETSLIALKVKDETLPVLVTGDLNDVAWSGTTTRFRRVSGLLDPRIGRKVFSTFDARYPLIRWPLDHLFHSADFRLAAMHRLPACGSDHFPVMFDLVLCRSEKAKSRPAEANGQELDRARELVDDARKRDEKPIGSDWED